MRAIPTGSYHFHVENKSASINKEYVLGAGKEVSYWAQTDKFIGQQGPVSR